MDSSSVNSSLIPRPVLDPDGSAKKSECLANLVLQKALIREVQFYFAVGEDDESRRPYRGLGHVVNLDALPRRDRGAFEVDVLEESVHFAGANTLAALAGHFFQCRKYFLRAFSGGCGDKENGRVAEELQRVAQSFLISNAIGGTLVLLHARRLSLAAGSFLAA